MTGLHPILIRHIAAVAALIGLGGCSTLLGGNVKGQFSCRAPDGICAPSARIDDQALAMIEGGAAPGSTPAVGVQGERSPARVIRTAPANPARTREKVLRIVFPAYIDERGRLHEASAVHAVVEQGDWQIGSADTSVQAAAAAPPPAGGTLAEAVDRALPPGAPAATADADAPSAEAVAAARARIPTTIEAIKADVAARIAAGNAGAAQPVPPEGKPKPAAGPSAPGPEAATTPTAPPVIRADGFPAQVEDPR